MIRGTTADDTSSLVELARETGVFKPIEIQALREVLDDYHAVYHREAHCSVTECEGDAVRGFAYYAPASMTDRTWYLYWIAVSKSLHGFGIGGELLRFAEADVRRANGRLLLIETSSLDHYRPTRSFYVKHGYEQFAVLADYYADGDDMVVFAKRFSR